MVLIMEEALQLCRKWLNGHIALHDPGRRPVGMPDMYRYVAVMLLSHLCGISLEKALDVLPRFDCNVPPADRMRFISQNILAYPATGRGNMGVEVWSSQRDATSRLDPFEKTAYHMSRNIFLTPAHTIVTLDDDLYGTRSKDNQVKTLSARKADREGHAADVVSDALFRLTYAVRFRRRGQSQSDNVEKLLDVLMEGRGGNQCMVWWLQQTAATALCRYCGVCFVAEWGRF